MSDTFQVVLQQAQSLARTEQLALIAAIAELLQTQETHLATIPDEVVVENRRRLAEYDAGTVEAVPFDEAMSEIREQIST